MVDDKESYCLGRCISVGLFGGIIPIILEYSNVDIERIYIITSILIITGSWVSRYLK